MKTHGQRQTKQREAILSTLQEAGRPLSWEEILTGARERCPRVGERTVFRNLREMLDEMLLVRVYLPGQSALYELPTGEHRPHFICRSCKQVYQLPGEAPEIMKDYTPPHGFQIEGEDLVFFGLCPGCT